MPIMKSVPRKSVPSVCRADGSIIIGARDFSPDSRSARHLLPYEWLFVIPGCFGNDIQPAAGRNPALGRSKSSLRSVEICGPRPQTEKPAELSFCGLCLPWQLSTPGAGDSWRRPRRSCAAAETGRGTAFALGFPIGGSLRCPCFIGNEIQPAAGRNPASRVEILTPFGRNLRAQPADGKARRTFVLRALFTPCLGVAAQQRRRMAAIYSRSRR